LLPFFFPIAEPHTAACSNERTERREHLLAAEPGAVCEAASPSREEPADLND